MKISILMTTYNGEEFISEQISSIIRQSFSEWRLYIRDDGSTDRTVQILNDFCHKDDRISLIKDEKGNLGAKNGFFELLNDVESDYFFFCDQDDLWYENKMKNSILKFKELNQKKPGLVYTNLDIINEKDELIRHDFYQSPSNDLNVVLSSNSVAGCTVVINDEMKKFIKNDCDEDIVMHDWWLALCAIAFENIAFCEESLIGYRQHSQNVVGTDYTLLKKISRLFNYKAEVSRQRSAFKQAAYFLKVHRGVLNEYNYSMVESYSNIMLFGFFKRMSSLIRYRFKKNSILGNLSLINLIMFKKSSFNMFR